MDDKPTIIRKSALAVIKDKKILMTREEQNEFAFYMLGGTIEAGESEEDCLKREVIEEVGIPLISDSLKYLAEFENDAHGKVNTRVNIKLYYGDLDGEPIPSSEIVEIAYFDSTINPKHLTPISEEIFSWLKNRNYIS
ncbi:MAG TPA: NUDIX domain-containing protein [Candidatus Saccharimonadales bacterium]